MYKDRHGREFEAAVHEWAVPAHLDLASAGHRDYDLPIVGGREYGAIEHHDMTDDENRLDD